MLDHFIAKNATAHKINFYYTLAISYCTFCVAKHTILGPATRGIQTVDTLCDTKGRIKLAASKPTDRRCESWYLGTGRMNADSIVKVCFSCVQLQSNGPALCDLPGIRTKHVQTNHTLLSQQRQQPGLEKITIFNKSRKNQIFFWFKSDFFLI